MSIVKIIGTKKLIKVVKNYEFLICDLGVNKYHRLVICFGIGDNIYVFLVVSRVSRKFNCLKS